MHWKGSRTNPLNWLDNDFETTSTAVRLGSYSSVTAPTQDEPTASTNKLQTITIGPVSTGDAAQVYALCNQLGLTAAGLYRETCADGNQWMLDIGPVSSGDAWYLMRKCVELKLIEAGLYKAEYVEG